MKKTMTFHRKKIWMVFLVCALMLLGLVGRLVYLMGVRSDYYYQKAEELHERERVIKAARGQILDAKGRILADNKTVCTISVIHSQIKDPQKVIEVLSKELEIDTDTVRKKVEKISSIERIKTNVEKSVIYGNHASLQACRHGNDLKGRTGLICIVQAGISPHLVQKILFFLFIQS